MTENNNFQTVLALAESCRFLAGVRNSLDGVGSIRVRFPAPHGGRYGHALRLRGVTLNAGTEVSLESIEAKLKTLGYDVGPNGITGPHQTAPTFKPPTKWSDRVLLEVFASEPKTKLFPERGWLPPAEPIF